MFLHSVVQGARTAPLAKALDVSDKHAYALALHACQRRRLPLALGHFSREKDAAWCSPPQQGERPGVLATLLPTGAIRYSDE
ncbi:MAG: hypothetical protein OHK0015_31340 [Chloroflexi bacterium OHK40]